jgi:prephenate dehydrogenase
VDAAAHDRNMAWISHLPQVASTVLAVVLAAEGIGPDDLGPGGRDLTRLAASMPALWSEIARENAPALSAAVRSLEERLREFRHALEAEDGDLVHDLFAAGSEWTRSGAEGFQLDPRSVIL